jgi:phospholipid transport system substrate-binding protein
MYKMLITGLAASIGVAGWPNLADAGLFSKTGPVIAIMADDLFLGEAEGHLSGAGTIAIHSQSNPGITCLGQFTSSAELGGLGQMQCSNGATGTYHFKRLTLQKGYGAGSYNQGSMSFTYGFTADESEPYLKLPPGKKLEHNGKTLALVDVSPAQAVAPDVLLNAVTSEVIAIIKEDKDFQAGRPMKVAYLIETRILPLFDFVRMTRMAVGRNWRLASTEQQTTLTTEFKTLLVRTYSTVLTSYRDQLIEFKQLRMAPDVTEVTVRSDVRQPGRERITIDYDMEKTPTGWKVYDIKVGGVSLVTTYRETFAGQVRDVGVDGLIKSLSDKNRRKEANLQPFKRWSFERFHPMLALMHSALQEASNTVLRERPYQGSQQ